MLISDWQLKEFSDGNLGKLQNCLEDIFLGEGAYPEWVIRCHDAILSELDRREAALEAENGVAS